MCYVLLFHTVAVPCCALHGIALYVVLLPCHVVIIQVLCVCMYVCTYTWRFMGTYKWGYKSPSMGHKYSYPTYNPTYIYP